MGDSGHKHFEPNSEHLETLMSMGLSKHTATEALFCTGNQSVDAAINFIFNNEIDDKHVCSGNEPENKNTDEKGHETDNSEEYEAEENEGDYYKMTFVVNSSLKMGIGKLSAQVAHACLGLYRTMLREGTMTDVLSNWEYVGEKKIVLKGIDHLHLQELHEKAETANIPSYLIRDAGKTQIPPNSVTVLSLFGLEEEIDKITGKLSLL